MGGIADRIIAELGSTAHNTPAIRAVRRRFSRELAEVDRETVLAAAHALIQRAPFGRFVAYELVHYHVATMSTITEKEVTRLGEGIQSWGEVDTFACYISGPAWEAGRISDTMIRRWAKSEDRWWRRAALVSTVPLNAGKRRDAESVEKTLRVCRLLLTDRDDMVVKAMSWALRKVAAHDPDSARTFLSQHQEKLAARVLREVQNKLNTGLKNPARTVR